MKSKRALFSLCQFVKFVADFLSLKYQLVNPVFVKYVEFLPQRALRSHRVHRVWLGFLGGFFVSFVVKFSLVVI